MLPSEWFFGPTLLTKKKNTTKRSIIGSVAAELFLLLTPAYFIGRFLAAPIPFPQRTVLTH